MPELPDITIYVEAIARRAMGCILERVRIVSPFVLRSMDPALELAFGQPVTAVKRVGKRIALGTENGLWLTIHLMIAGRLHWKEPNAKLSPRNSLAAFDFDTGSLTFTEAGAKRRASLNVTNEIPSASGLDVFTASEKDFQNALTAENHTLKRILTDPRIFDGIGNAYSDEILHKARLSPSAMTQKLTDEEMGRLSDSIRETLRFWTGLLRLEAGTRFPEKVTAFRPEMSVHGKFGEPCPVCGTKICRIRYASNETNYCPECQTGGRVLADRSRSRLLGKDWLKSTI